MKFQGDGPGETGVSKCTEIPEVSLRGKTLFRWMSMTEWVEGRYHNSVVYSD